LEWLLDLERLGIRRVAVNAKVFDYARVDIFTRYGGRSDVKPWDAPKPFFVRNMRVEIRGAA
jgi:hypothetical protein